ncbi:hypothetical protein PENANT_c055G02171 [Penicillium antarcticum]|uniref:LYR motif-containing protein Cup1-like N-terminal domain-containing protein n=1 Tax=Penicillium antarcticum TaxID=416450 RepID=A0A1V6PQN4_9EURO|nr:uncharacterized protein N7508_001910 [Penicillium antarcticum]KAJ5317402.1 hypothetical protein N7508_001910 [Penicillium antarcticum]OQD79295.1 hypothetical protein PENANT_c055G02171 [Penicillium antarcticum]
MAKLQPQHWLGNLSTPQQWRHLLRATLRECTYLPDPVARTYMREHVLSRYRAVSSRHSKAGPQMVHAARNGLSVLQRANEGYSRPLEKILYLSYGRTGKRRHEMLAELLKPENPGIPNDTQAAKELISAPLKFHDGWQPPAIVRSLALSHVRNPVITSSRVRPLIKAVSPPIPKQDIWGKELAQSRKVKIRKHWYFATLNSLLPPLPEEDLRTLDGLVSGTTPWEPVKRRKGVKSEANARSESAVLKLLVKGPEKENTFADYANGRPHVITARFMRRLWRRISALVPRQSWNEVSQKWRFEWDTPKLIPTLSYSLDSRIDSGAFFEEPPKPFRGNAKKPVRGEQPLPQ